MTLICKPFDYEVLVLNANAKTIIISRWDRKPTLNIQKNVRLFNPKTKIQVIIQTGFSIFNLSFRN